jgi:type I restriction enzyme S subunit
VRLRYLAEITTGSGDTQDADDGPYPFIVRSQTPLGSSEYTFDTEAILTVGDGAVGEVFHHIRGRFHVHQRVYVLHSFSTRIVSRFLYYFFLSFFKLIAQDGSARTTVDSVRRWMLTDMPVAVPPVGDQRRIADYLDRETAEIDAFIADQERLIELLTERRAAVANRLVTRGSNERAALRVVSLPWLNEAPKHWQTCQVKRLFLSMVYGTSDPATEGPVTALAMGDIQGGRVLDADRGGFPIVPLGLDLRRGDILFDRTNGSADVVGKVGLFDGDGTNTTFASYLVRLRTVNAVDSAWAVFLLNSAAFWPFARSHAIKTLQVNLSPSRYGSLPVVLPPLEEQRSIGTRIREESVELNTAIADAQQAVALSRERRAALITAAVTGQIDVTRRGGAVHG